MFGIYRRLDTILRNQEKIMALIDDLTASVAAETTVETSMETLLTNISVALAAAGTDPAKLAALKTTIDANTAKMTALVVANTPAAPPASGQR